MDDGSGLASGANFEGMIKIEEEKIRSHFGPGGSPPDGANEGL